MQFRCHRVVQFELGVTRLPLRLNRVSRWICDVGAPTDGAFEPNIEHSSGCRFERLGFLTDVANA